jgi:hypothetical protein
VLDFVRLVLVLPFLLFFEFLPRYLGSTAFFVLICLILSGGAGKGLGVDNLFHDDPSWRA